MSPLEIQVRKELNEESEEAIKLITDLFTEQPRNSDAVICAMLSLSAIANPIHKEEITKIIEELVPYLIATRLQSKLERN